MLDPLPIDFDEAAHTYVWQPTGEKLAYSVTQVCGFDKTPAQLANIEKYREGPTGWEARGVAVHAALEAFLKKEEPEFPLDSAIFAEWVAPLLAHSFWKDFEPLLIEGRLCDLKKSVGGSCDALGKWRGKTVLVDLKTQGKSTASKYSTDRQLGGYLVMLNNSYGVEIDECRTIWCRPGRTEAGKDQGTLKCFDAWNFAWTEFKKQQPAF